MKQSGFVLWMVLIFLSLMSLLILAQLEMLMNYQKTLQAIALKHQHRRTLEQLAAGLLQKNMARACVQPKAASPDLSTKLLNNASACHIKKHHKIYDYVFENLSVQPCWQIRQHQKVFSAHHWRLTIAAHNNQNLILQIHYVKPVPYQQCLDKKQMIWIVEGVKSWRMI